MTKLAKYSGACYPLSLTVGKVYEVQHENADRIFLTNDHGVEMSEFMKSEFEFVEEGSALKFDSEKPRTELLSSVALLATAKVMAHGAKKYDAHNWRKGFEWSRLIGAALRHLLAFNNGEDKDPESGLSHLDHAACCIMFLQEHEIKKLGTDDRYKQPGDKNEEAS